MNEPTRYSMATGLPVQPKVKTYPLNQTAEQSFWSFIAEHKKARQDWHNKAQNNEDNKESDQT